MNFTKEKIYYSNQSSIYSITFKNNNNYEITFYNYGGYIHSIKIPFKNCLVSSNDTE